MGVVFVRSDHSCGCPARKPTNRVTTSQKVESSKWTFWTHDRDLIVVTKVIAESQWQIECCIHERGRRSSVSEPPEFHWLAASGSLTLDHQPPTDCRSALSVAIKAAIVLRRDEARAR